MTEDVEEVIEGQEQATSSDDAFAVFEGAALKKEKAPADAHEGDIIAVTRLDSEKGSTAIVVNFTSRNTGQTGIEWQIWVPSFFRDNVHDFLTKKLGIEDLPPGEVDPENPKKVRGNQRMHYGMAIRNTDGNAAVQSLLTIAAKSGRSAAAAGITGPPADFDEYVEQLNTVLADLYVVFTRRPEKNEDQPQFDGRLKVSSVYFPGEVVGNPKALKKYVKQWENQ